MLTYNFMVPGTLAGNHVFCFNAPCDIQIVHVSLSNSTANAGTLKIGNSSDDDAYLAAENFGVSHTPVEVKTPAGFDGVTAALQYPHIAKATVVKVTITNSGTAMADAFVTITATEG
jgi:hypothetical protein